MSADKFAELCRGTAKMLEALANDAHQCCDGEMEFYLPSAPETMCPLLEIAVEIAKASKKS